MIGIHMFGEIYWFEFPRTLESQEMLIARLEREAISRTSFHRYCLAMVGRMNFQDIIKTWDECGPEGNRSHSSLHDKVLMAFKNPYEFWASLDLGYTDGPHIDEEVADKINSICRGEG